MFRGFCQAGLFSTKLMGIDSDLNISKQPINTFLLERLHCSGCCSVGQTKIGIKQIDGCPESWKESEIIVIDKKIFNDRMTMKLCHCWYFPLLFYESQVMSVGFAAVLWLKPSTSQCPNTHFDSHCVTPCWNCSLWELLWIPLPRLPRSTKNNSSQVDCGFSILWMRPNHLTIISIHCKLHNTLSTSCHFLPAFTHP